MTTTDHPQRERTQHDQGAQANQQHAAEQRQDAAHVGHAVAVARSERIRAQHLGADSRRLEDAFDILAEQINGREDMTVLRPGNVLRHDPGAPEQGTANVAAVCEFVDRIIQGELPFDALEEMHAARMDRHLAPAVRHAESMYQRAHRLENAATVQPALPAGPSQLSNGVPQQRREPIAPPEPEVPHVDEDPRWSTMQAAAIALEGEAKGQLKPATVQRLQDEGFQSRKAVAPDMGPAAPTQFAAAAIPQQRDIRDTQPMRLDEVLGHLALDDAGAEVPNHDTKDGPGKSGKKAVPPFVAEAASAGGESND